MTERKPVTTSPVPPEGRVTDTPSPVHGVEDLKPCPFPHEGTDLHEGSWLAKHQYWVHCPCGAMGPTGTSPQKARDRWNTRSAATALEAMQARLDEIAKIAESAIDKIPGSVTDDYRVLCRIATLAKEPRHG